MPLDALTDIATLAHSIDVIYCYGSRVYVHRELLTFSHMMHNCIFTMDLEFELLRLFSLGIGKC